MCYDTHRPDRALRRSVPERKSRQENDENDEERRAAPAAETAAPKKLKRRFFPAAPLMGRVRSCH